jgi:hypothetical protein
MAEAEQAEGNGMAAAAASDTISQVRELLFGETQRRNDSQAARLQKLIDELESRLAARLDRLEARVASLAEAVDDDRRQSLATVGKELASLGQQIAKLGDQAGRARSG